MTEHVKKYSFNTSKDIITFVIIDFSASMDALFPSSNLLARSFL
jgi:hypothetical protein